jgi:hypothetical protein
MSGTLAGVTSLGSEVVLYVKIDLVELVAGAEWGSKRSFFSWVYS